MFFRQLRIISKTLGSKQLPPSPPHPHPQMGKNGVKYEAINGVKKGVESGVKKGVESGVKKGVESGAKKGVERRTKEGVKSGV